MTIAQLNGGGRLCSGVGSRNRLWNTVAKANASRFSLQQSRIGDGCAAFDSSCRLSLEHSNCVSSLLTRRRKHNFPVVYDQLNSDCSVESLDTETRLVLGEENGFTNSNKEHSEMRGVTVSESHTLVEKIEVASKSHTQDAKNELIVLTLPAIAGQVIDPLAQLMETAYVGRLGSVELASAGVSISIFNIVSKLFNIPLLSVATSFVAEDIAKNLTKDLAAGLEGNGKPPNGTTERKQLSSVSTALLLAVGIGIFEAAALSLASGPFLNLMGVPSASAMHGPAKKFLMLRALGSPAFVVSLALQGIFRGFKDTKTPVLCIGNLLAVFLFPILIYFCQLGMPGAAISTVVSQYIVAVTMIWFLNKKVVLMPPKMGALQFGDYVKSGGFLLGRTLAVLITMTLGTSMAARQGSDAMAAHQICMQVWLAVSLLTDALAASGQIGVLTGVSLATILGLSFGSLAPLFTKDPKVLGIVGTGVLFVSASQPINALAFIFDGLHYGVSDFRYAACSMMLVGAMSSTFLLYAPRATGLPGVWAGLTLFMGLRTVAGFVRLLSKSGPWWFLHTDLEGAKVGGY
ncbi:protein DETOXIFICATION 45 [Citrus sinensis]|uniref:Protein DETOXIFICATION 45 n=1 Tax=Citrus sinensis TaxID=2711 RepID=A0ACB8IBP5_CITSI|nr:protein DETOXIFICATION 45 [Citrus sinensis]